MPGLVRKLLIFSTLEGLILQSHGPTEHHKAICIQYKNRALTNWTKSSDPNHSSSSRLESHGIIGLISVASLSFLVAITRREQVAQIYGKPVFVVTDVALLPLSSHPEASEAINAALGTQAEDDDFSDSDVSDDGSEHHSTSGPEVFSPFEEDRAFHQRTSSNTSFAEDVARRKASYGKFASEWFSKRVWTPRVGHITTPRPAAEPVKAGHGLQTTSESSKTDSSEAAAQTNQEATSETVAKADLTADVVAPSNLSIMSLLPKLLRSTKIILSSKSFYFAYDFDLTRRLSALGGRCQAPSRETVDPLFFWNRRMGSAFLDAGHEAFLMPIMQGFVGQRTFEVKPAVLTSNEGQSDPGDGKETNKEKEFLLTLISRRSARRSGLRYLRRGIDDEGNCANFAETEQILSSPEWDATSSIRSFVQIRGSIPLYFSQSPYSLKPVPMLHNSPAANKAAFRRHFQTLNERYGAVQIDMLVDKHGTESTIGETYQKLYTEVNQANQLNDTAFEWFDFHSECRGMKFENVERLVRKLEANITKWGETIISREKIQTVQSGVIRTNCMDCLDRTNVAQSAFGQHVLQRDIEEEGYQIDLLHDESTNWFNTLWADNGDAISRQYASTAALKGDFTRTRKRNWQGAVNDLGLTLSRYYSNMVNDYFSQAVIDVLLGNASWKIFEDFESTMMSADPGISVSAAREAAIENCTKIVIQNHDEELIHGWTLLSPAQSNTLRTLPFEETVVLLTDTAVYCCKFDWNTEKVASFEKVDLRSITQIRHGTYVTSTFTQRQMDEELNQGLVICFTPGKGDIIRVNTRSLQSSIDHDTDSNRLDGGTGILSWFSPGMTRPNSRTMALKIITQNGLPNGDEAGTIDNVHTPRAEAEHISDQIRRAIEGPTVKLSESNLVDEGDIIGVVEAKRRTGYLEQLGHSLKRMVWA